MIDFSNIFLVFRSIIKNRIEPVIGREIRVIQTRTTGAKPKEVFATMDIMFIDDKNSYLTNSWYDSDEMEQVYETHKDIRIQLSVRNGNPDNLTDQMSVYTLCNHLHKAFVEQPTLNYLASELGATVSSVQPLRTLSDFVPTGVGSIQVFDIIIAMNDVTTVQYVPVENVEVVGTIGGEEVEIDVSIPTIE